jgi:hypothetical protein
MFKDFELPFVPFVVSVFVSLVFVCAVIDRIQTAPVVPPPENFNEYTNEWFVSLPDLESSQRYFD